MFEPVVLSREFAGDSFTIILDQKQPYWIGREIGKAAGYARDGERLVTNIRHGWKDEFIENQDYLIISGDELRDFKALLQRHTNSVGHRAKHLLLLSESGLHLALSKTNKPIGRKLRRFFADEFSVGFSRT